MAEKIDIEFRQCQTASYSPWHLELLKKADIPVIVNGMIGVFVRVNDDVYLIKYHHVVSKLQDVVSAIQKDNDEGKITDEEAVTEIKKIFSDENVNLLKQTSLSEFKKDLKMED